MPTHTTSAPERLISCATASLLGVGQRAERRRVAADDLQPGMAQPQHARELRERALVAAAVEVEALAGARGAGAGAVHQLRAVDAVLERVAERAQRPHERLAVRHREVGAQHGGAQRRVLLAGHDRVDGGDADVAAAAGGDRRVDPVERRARSP